VFFSHPNERNTMQKHPQWAVDMYRSFSTADLLHQRFLSGRVAREGAEAGMDEVSLCNQILTERNV
jgi:hypothetical protein